MVGPIVFFGLGSIGQRHARLLQAMGGASLIAFRSSHAATPNPLGLPEVFSWEELAARQPQVAVISNPTNQHIDTALACAERGLALFIEKPIGDSVRGLAPLLEMVETKRLSTYVAYCLRFHPVVQALHEALRGVEPLHVRMSCASYLPTWRADWDRATDYRTSRARGGGVVFELSHELDLIEHLFGPIASLRGQSGRVAQVTIDAEDYADLLVTARCPVNLHVNFMSRATERRIHVDTADGYFVADLVAGTLQHGGGADPWSQSIPAARDVMYQAQWRYFLDRLGAPRMMNDLPSAVPLFEKLVAFREQGAA